MFHNSPLAVLLVIAALVVALYNFSAERSVTYFASIVAVCGTMAILIQTIFKSKKSENKAALPMKKKMMTILIIVAVVIGAAFAWRVAYAVRKSTDNLPTLEMLAEMDDASFLVGYRSNQLITVWGEPDEDLQVRPETDEGMPLPVLRCNVCADRYRI